MTEQVSTPRPRQITRSAYICAFFALFPLAYTIQAMAYGVAVGKAGIATVAIAAGGCVCTFLLLSLNRLALVAFALFWLLLIGAASYSWAALNTSHDARGLLGILFLVASGVVLWTTIHRNWPSSGARSNLHIERTHDG